MASFYLFIAVSLLPKHHIIPWSTKGLHPQSLAQGWAQLRASECWLDKGRLLNVSFAQHVLCQGTDTSSAMSAIYNFWASSPSGPRAFILLSLGAILPSLRTGAVFHLSPGQLSVPGHRLIPFHSLEEYEVNQWGDAWGLLGRKGPGHTGGHGWLIPWFSSSTVAAVRGLCREKGAGMCFGNRVSVLYPALPAPRALEDPQGRWPKGGNVALSSLMLRSLAIWTLSSAAPPGGQHHSARVMNSYPGQGLSKWR